MAGSTEIASYDPRLVVCVLAGSDLAGLDEGEPISVDRATAESIKFKEGIYGDVMISISASRLYIVTLKVQPSSRANRLLQGWHDRMMTTRRAWFPFNVNDINDDTAARFSSPKACVMQVPGLKRGAEASGNEYKILASNGTLAHAGMPEIP